jgi:hypothetical protein
MTKVKKSATFILILSFLFSTLLPSHSFSCQKSIERTEARVVCLLPDQAKGRFKPVMALVTDDGEFYPIAGSEDSTLSLNVDKEKLRYNYTKTKIGGK